LRTITYEGIEIETCPSCRGEWLGPDELGKITRLRGQRFSEDERRAIAESTTYTGVRLEEVDRDLTCPACGGKTDSLNYGGGSGIILDKCTACGGIWLEDKELEKVQMLVEGWEDKLPEDLAKHGEKLREIEVRLDKADDVTVSRLPVVGRFINAAINGILDLKL
jgi:Zn-finger nucleic acid-binding protein